MGQVVYLGLCLLSCLILNPTAEGSSKGSAVRPRSPCPPGALYHNRVCYEFLDDPISWDDAENNCQFWRNGHLASIHSLVEDKLVANYIKSSRATGRVWIGLKAKATSKLTWGWSDGSAYIPGAPLWNNQRPSTSLSSSQCIALLIENRSGASNWSQCHCSGLNPYICKYPAAY